MLVLYALFTMYWSMVYCRLCIVYGVLLLCAIQYTSTVIKHFTVSGLRYLVQYSVFYCLQAWCTFYGLLVDGLRSTTKYGSMVYRLYRSLGYMVLRMMYKYSELQNMKDGGVLFVHCVCLLCMAPGVAVHRMVCCMVLCISIKWRSGVLPRGMFIPSTVRCCALCVVCGTESIVLEYSV
jgi:hypothetical protein